jgi:hypothetical protein
MPSSRQNKKIFATALLILAVGLLVFRLTPYIKEWAKRPAEDTTENQIRGMLAQGGAARPPSLSSPREEQERSLFMDVAAPRHADVVVLPFSPTQAVSLDRTARSLMTYRLANAIRSRTNLSVADPGVVMRALGVQRRNYEPERAKKLAKKLGAKWVISTEIARPVAAIPEDTPLVYSLSVRCAPVDELDSTQLIVLRNIEFSDELPPEEAFRAVLDRLLEQLPIGPLKPKPDLLTAGSLNQAFPEDPFSLVSDSPLSPVEQAIRLQVLASLYQASEVKGALLWERSIVALDTVSSDTSDYRVLRARAYHHLGRRPYALAILGSDTEATDSSARSALRAFIDGNLPALTKFAAETNHPALQLISQIELEYVRSAYKKQDGYEDRRKAILGRWPEYEPLLRLRLSASDWANPEIPYLIAHHLGDLEVPVAWAEDRWTDYVYILMERLRNTEQSKDYDFLPATALEWTFASLWKSAADRLIGEGLGPRVTRFDYFELLQEINREAAFKGVRLICCIQARNQPARAAMKEFKRSFPVDADVASTEVHIAYQLIRQTDAPDWNAPEAEQADRLARDAYLWEGGESMAASAAESLLWRKSHIKYLDEPISRSRRWTDAETNRIAGTPKQVDERWLRRNLRELKYTDTHARLLQNIEGNLDLLGRAAEFASIFEQNGNRFDGSRTRVDLLAESANRRGDIVLEERLRHEALQANPDDWNAYWRLGWIYLERHNLQQVQETLLAYPKFRTKKQHPVELGNKASDAASMLLRAGETEMARPLLELCAKLRTGSGAQMQCDETLAVMSGDYAAATDHARRNLERYPSSDNALSFIRYLFMRGHAEEAWEAYDQWSMRFFDDEIQNAAAFGDRVLGRSDEEIIDAAAHWKHRPDDVGREDWLRDERLFVALFPDRDASEQTLSIFRSAVKGHAARLYVDLAKGYLAFQRREYKAALESWRAVDQHLTDDSFKQSKAKNFLLPYLAVAYAMTGDPGDGKRRLQAYASRFPGSDEAHTLKAVNLALDNQTEEAIAAFWKAFINAANDDNWRPLEGRLVILEVLEVLNEYKQGERYGDLIADLAQRQARTQPRAYAFGFEAKYSKSEAERVPALAHALYLDRRSLRLKHIPIGERQKAMAWWHKEQPYLASE